MYYEAYGAWMTNLLSIRNNARNDSYSWNGTPQYQPFWTSNDNVEQVLGIVPRYKKAGTHPIYAGRVTYANSQVNYFVACQPVFDLGDGSTWEQLNDNKPIFWLYDNPGAGRIPIYACFDPATSDSYISTNAACPPDGFWGCNGHLLGYAIASPNSPDMRHANQNRICLATSNDGVNWTRFNGNAPGNAVIAPQNAFTNVYPHNCSSCNPQELYDLHRAYGSGFPVALVRDDHLELWFTDDTTIPMNNNVCGNQNSPCTRPTPAWRIRIPVSQIESPNAYTSAQRLESGAGIPIDLRWSPLYRRYFSIWVWHADGQECTNASPRILWSDFDPDPNQPVSSFDGFNFLLDVGNVVASGHGGILSNEKGETVDFFAEDPSIPTPYTAFHLYYPASVTGCNFFSEDLYHTLVFGYAKDGDGDGYADWFETTNTAVTVLRGQQISGGVNQLSSSDNNRLVIRSGISYRKCELVISVDSQLRSAEKLTIDIESKLSRAGGSAKLLAYNWTTQIYEVVDTWSMSTTDNVRTLSDISSASYLNESGNLLAKFETVYR